MQYDNEQMTFIGAPTNPAENAALALHYEIMAAAQAAASSLLALARKIKQMRDTGGYRALGFDTLEDYTCATMGMKQRQAYNYIAIAEKLPAQLIEQNAAAGVTKLALLAQLSSSEQQQIADHTDLTATTVAALKEQIKTLQAQNAGYAEQLSLLQEAAPVADTQAEEIDMDALRESIRAEVEAQYRDDLNAAEQDRRERDAALAAARQTRAELEEVRRRAADEAAAHAQALAELKKKSTEATRVDAPQAADCMVRFGLLFDQLQDTTEKLLALTDAVKTDGDSPKAEKMRTALKNALMAVAESI